MAVLSGGGEAAFANDPYAAYNTPVPWIRRSIPWGVSSCSRTRSSRLAWPISGQMGRGERGPTAGAGKEGNRAED